MLQYYKKILNLQIVIWNTMLSRRQLRMKVLQSFYAFVFSENDNIVSGEKELLKSVLMTKEVCVWQISIALEIVRFLERKFEDRKNKFLPTDEDLNPNYRLINNRIIKQWNENASITALMSKYRINWIEHEEVFRRLCYTVENAEFYKNYLNNDDSYANDKNFLIDLYREVISEDDFFYDFFESKNIYAYTDFIITNFLMIKLIENFEEGYDTSTSFEKMAVIDSSLSDGGDVAFAKELFAKSIIHKEEYTLIANKFISNWDMERLSVLDTMIIVMAICEMLNFSSIPVRVTMNEYIDLTKIFSTPKSNAFVNGVLDAVYNCLNEEGKINKIGRGLM